MSEDDTDLATRLDELRHTFDTAWSKPASAAPDIVELLLVGYGGEDVALRLSEVVGVQALTSLTPCPAKTPALIGLTSSRGAIVPVYSVGAWLGDDRKRGNPRWLVLARRGRDDTRPHKARAAQGLIGFGFEVLHGRLSVAPTAIEIDPAAAAGHGHGRYGLLRHEARVHHVLDLTTIIRLMTRVTEEP